MELEPPAVPGIVPRKSSPAPGYIVNVPLDIRHIKRCIKTEVALEAGITEKSVYLKPSARAVAS